MLNVGAFIYNLLTTSSALTALVSSSNILSSYPDAITIFPSVIFSDEQRDIEFVDELPTASNSDVTIHVYVRDDTPYTISNVVCNLMKSIYWSCVSNVDSPDPDTAVRHRVMRFTRPLLTGDI